jgi:hypothetical protein
LNKKLLFNLTSIVLLLFSITSFSQTVELGSLSTFEDFTKRGVVTTTDYEPFYSTYFIKTKDAIALTIVDYSVAIEGSDTKSSMQHYNGLYSSKIINSIALTIVDYSFAIDTIEDSYTPLQVVGVANHFGNVKVNDTI